MALNSKIYADVPLRNCSLTHSDNATGCHRWRQWLETTYAHDINDKNMHVTSVFHTTTWSP